MTDSSRFIIPGPAYEDTQAEVLLYAFSGAIDSGDIGGMIIEQLLHARLRLRKADLSRSLTSVEKSRRLAIHKAK